MIRTNRSAFALVSAAAFSGTAVWLLVGLLAMPTTPASSSLWLAGVAGMALYLCSHLLRAIRLAVIGVAVHRTSFRTLFLLNFAVAPWSMILPFKLDELVRVNELRSLNCSLVRALMTIVIDRLMDGPMLLLCAAYLAWAGPGGAAFASGLAGLAMIAITTGFFVLAPFLRFVQHYVFVHHYRPRALRLLSLVHHLRLLVELGRATIARAAPVLLVCTVGIWCCELAAVAVLGHLFAGGGQSLPDILIATFVRANSGWRTILLGSAVGHAAGPITALFTASLFLVWPAAIVGYLRRRSGEVANAAFLHRQLA